ncbi:MAG: helix-turn-helix transcriptional regulator [Chitinophagales bacterium]|nr:helix-turn-helix transcriptional regulator [Chitinophagales bacterium]
MRTFAQDNPNMSQEIYVLIGENVRKEREKLGINQVELGNRVKFNRSSISNIEKGKQKTPIHVLYRIAKELQVDVRDFLPSQNEIEQVLSNEDKRLRGLYEKHGQGMSYDEFIKLFN